MNPRDRLIPRFLRLSEVAVDPHSAFLSIPIDDRRGSSEWTILLYRVTMLHRHLLGGSFAPTKQHTPEEPASCDVRKASVPVPPASRCDHLGSVSGDHDP
jgi:hypothetical protein